MTKYIKGKDGKMAGSIGDGKTNVPTAAPVVAPRSGFCAQCESKEYNLSDEGLCAGCFDDQEEAGYAEAWASYQNKQQSDTANTSAATACRTCRAEIAPNLPWFGECKKCYDKADDCASCDNAGCAECDDSYDGNEANAAPGETFQDVLNRLAVQATTPADLPARGRYVRITRDGTGRLRATFCHNGAALSDKFLTDQEINELGTYLHPADLSTPLDVPAEALADDIANGAIDLDDTNFTSHFDDLARHSGGHSSEN